MPYSNTDGFTFALPPSMGRDSLRPVARFIADLLSDYGFGTFWPVSSYEKLEQALLSGEAHAAWAPPVVCAHVERAGGMVAYRAVRMGSVSYRSALLCRGERSIDLKRLDGYSGLAPIRAAWIDPYSAAGCVMPRRYLRNLGANLGAAVEERFLGSYRACFDAVLEGDADLTATYVGRRGSGYIDLCGDRAAELRVLAWTDEIPNDGVAISPALSNDQARAVTEALDAVFANETVRDQLALALDSDGFVGASPGSYESVQQLIEEDAADSAAEAAASAARPRREQPMRRTANPIFFGRRLATQS